VLVSATREVGLRSRAEIVAMLRSRGLHAWADWVERDLPDLVDTSRNAALLRTLDIDPAALGNLRSGGLDPEIRSWLLIHGSYCHGLRPRARQIRHTYEAEIAPLTECSRAGYPHRRNVSFGMSCAQVRIPG
jgi:hypothetical protein